MNVIPIDRLGRGLSLIGALRTRAWLLAALASGLLLAAGIASDGRAAGPGSEVAGAAGARLEHAGSLDRLVAVDNHQIDLVDLDSDQERTVGSSLQFDSAALSPDGAEIAANEQGGIDVRTGKDATSWGLFVVNADTGTSKRLTSGDDQNPAWSPDGKWIAFSRGEGQPPLKGQGLYVIRHDGTGLRLVKSGFVTAPAWSPDGKQIAFDYWTTSGWDHTSGDWRHTTASLTVVSPAGTELRRLTTHTWTETKQGADDTAPIWSPSGAWIAFQRTIGAGDNGGSFVYVIHPNGSGLRRVTPAGYFAEPTGWSPDSTKLADWRSKICNACSAGLGPAQAWITTLANGGGTAVGASSSVTWSPSGKLVGFGCDQAPSGICVIGPDGSVAQTISGTPPAANGSSQSVEGIVVEDESAVAGRTHTYNIAQLATDSRTGEQVHGVRLVKVFKASVGTAQKIGSTSIRYTAPKGINNKTARIRFLATYPGGSAPIPGLLTLLILRP